MILKPVSWILAGKARITSPLTQTQQWRSGGLCLCFSFTLVHSWVGFKYKVEIKSVICRKVVNPITNANTVSYGSRKVYYDKHVVGMGKIAISPCHLSDTGTIKAKPI